MSAVSSPIFQLLVLINTILTDNLMIFNVTAGAMLPRQLLPLRLVVLQAI